MEFKSNINTVVDRLTLKLNNIADLKQAKGEIAQALLVSNQDRVHLAGKDTKGKSIGQYSTKPTLIGASSFTTKGAARKVLGSKKKRRALQWRKVKGNNLAVLPGGYKEIRRIEGRETSKVNLDRTGKLRNSLRIIGKAKVFSVGFNAYGSRLSRWMEEKYGERIWGISRSDDKVINDILKRHLKNA